MIKNYILLVKYGRRPITSKSFILMTLSSFLCAFGPERTLEFCISYFSFILASCLLACSTRGIYVSDFVLSSETSTDDWYSSSSYFF